jgi:hypothetical protein
MNCILLSAFIGQYIELNIIIFSQSLSCTVLRHREHFIIFHSEPYTRMCMVRMLMTFEIYFDCHVLHDMQNKNGAVLGY